MKIKIKNGTGEIYEVANIQTVKDGLYSDWSPDAIEIVGSETKLPVIGKPDARYDILQRAIIHGGMSLQDAMFILGAYAEPKRLNSQELAKLFNERKK